VQSAEMIRLSLPKSIATVGVAKREERQLLVKTGVWRLIGGRFANRFVTTL
jgi:hypothetical protein